MSGDVQPRKRKDKKRKKDELGVEEPRGTAAALGEGDVFMHSQHDHGTGGHWCAKIIFFSLLAVLITLIGLIILENRGLTELEANSVESRYSGVLEGWLEDAPEDDHHDEHTLELNHPDEDDDHGDEHGHDDDDDDDHDDDHEHDEDEEHDDDEDEEHDDDEDEEHDDDDDDEEQDHDEENDVDDDKNDEDDDNHSEDDEQNQSEIDDDEDQKDIAYSGEENDEVEEHHRYRRYLDNEQADDSENDEENDDDDLQQVDDDDDVNERDQDEGSSEDEQNESVQKDDDDDEQSEEKENVKESAADDEEEEEHDEEEEEDTEVEIERIEREVDLEPISTELPALPEEDEDDNKSEDQSTELEAQDIEDEEDGVAPEDLEDDDFLEDDGDEPPIEHITAPVGKPLAEVEEEDSSEQPPDTLAEEDEYEKQQEEKRREEEKSGHMWLKLTVGGALLVATHAVIRRATAPREAGEEERSVREETPLIDRRMTLIPEEPIPAPRVSPSSYTPPTPKEEVVQRAPIVTHAPPPQEEEDEEDEEKQTEDEEDIEVVPSAQDTEEKELYSDEEEVEEEEIEVKKEAPKLSAPKPEEKAVPKQPEPEPEAEDDPDDVEIIDDEQLEEELEEEEDEEDISDVDDAELLSRLEAKYGRLPEPERPGQKHKDGGNSIEDEWPGEPSDAFWRQELDSAERDLRQGAWAAAAARAAAPALRDSARARWLVASAADREAEARRDNRQLGRAIAAYLELLKMHERLSDKKLKEVTARTLDRIMFRGNYLGAEPVYRLLIRRFPEEVAYRNNLTISFLMANRADLAEDVLKETLQKWPNDRVALAHYGFVLKTLRNRLEEAVEAFQKALEGDTGPANEPRFYYHLGDALLLLGRPAEAHEVHKRGAKLGHFLSPAQRSLYNVPRLKSRPWWNVDETPYAKLARALEKSWKEILKEGEAAKALYEKEKEGLKERGDWTQLDLFARGQEIPDRCKKAPVTCSVVRSEAAAVGCRRGQIKFSAMQPGTHVRAHVGPTNCRLRMHLGLSNTKDTFIRVDQTIRQWQVGKVLMFDDSFEHEVWHNGTGARLVLIVDVWHPDLTPHERRTLPAI